MNQPKTTATDLAIETIRPADINVHAPEAKDNEDFTALVRSIRENGLYHRIIVRPDGDGGFVCVDGHRRLAAAKAAGFTTVPVEIREITEDEAMEITISANILRTANDPLQEAELIERLREKGKTLRDIASVCGWQEGYAARRARLTSLVPAWRDFGNTHKTTIDLLERIAAHEARLQNEVAAALDIENEPTDDDREYNWDDFNNDFDSRLRTIDEDTVFDTAGCKKCTDNTANHGFLFAGMNDDECARCQNAACYTRKNNEFVDKQIAALKAKGKTIIEVADRWKVPDSWRMTPQPTDICKQAYTWEQDGMKRLAYSVPPPVKMSEAMTEEEKIAAREAKRAEKFKRDKMASSYGKVRDALEEENLTAANAIDAIIESAAFREYSRRVLLEKYNSFDGYITDGELLEFIDMAGTLPALEDMLGIEFDQDERKILEAELAERRRDPDEEAANADGESEAGKENA